MCVEARLTSVGVTGHAESRESDGRKGKTPKIRCFRAPGLVPRETPSELSAHRLNEGAVESYVDVPKEGNVFIVSAACLAAVFIYKRLRKTRTHYGSTVEHYQFKEF